MENDLKALKRKAKALLLSKDIPAGKMDIVRALLINDRVLEEEKYRAIIDLIKNYPDKPVMPVSPGKVEVKGADEFKKIKQYDSKNTNILYHKYKHTKLFKKRLLVHANNKFGIGFLRRLIPSPKFLKVSQRLFDLQSALRQRMYKILTDIVDDKSIDNPVIFNYCVVLYNALESVCLLDKHYMELKWSGPEEYKQLLSPYIESLLKLSLLDTGTKEAIIQLIDQKMRESEDLQKKPENINKKNLSIEQYIYDFVTTIRCFLYPATTNDCSLIAVLKKETSLPSFESFCVACVEALITGKPVALADIINMFFVSAPKVSDTAWNFDHDELVKAGKDAESLKRKAKEALHKKLDPYDELFRFLTYAPEGKEVMIQCFEDQRKMVDKRNEQYEDTYSKDIVMLLEGMLLGFINQYGCMIDGSVLYFENGNNQYEGCIFTESYFMHEFARFAEILSEINIFRTNNPTFHVTRDELIEGINKKKKSLYPIERFMTVIGDMFYDMGIELFMLYNRHRNWILNGATGSNDAIMRTAFSARTSGVLPFDDDEAIPIPFSDCLISGFTKSRALSKLLLHKPVIHATLRDGVFPQMAAFCLQVAHLCLNDRLYGHLDERTRILTQIRGLA